MSRLPTFLLALAIACAAGCTAAGGAAPQPSGAPKKATVSVAPGMPAAAWGLLHRVADVPQGYGDSVTIKDAAEYTAWRAALRATGDSQWFDSPPDLATIDFTTQRLVALYKAPGFACQADWRFVEKSGELVLTDVAEHKPGGPSCGAPRMPFGRWWTLYVLPRDAKPVKDARAFATLNEITEPTPRPGGLAIQALWHPDAPQTTGDPKEILRFRTQKAFSTFITKTFPDSFAADSWPAAVNGADFTRREVIGVALQGSTCRGQRVVGLTEAAGVLALETGEYHHGCEDQQAGPYTLTFFAIDRTESHFANERIVDEAAVP